MTEKVSQQELTPSAIGLPKTRSINQVVRRVLSIREVGSLILLVLLLGFFSIYNPGFRSPLNIGNILSFVPEFGIIALGMTLLLTAGEIDLSVGSLFAFCQVVMFILVREGILGWELAFVAVLLLAALNGLIIGLLVTKSHISSFLITLGMMLVLRGATILITAGFPLSTFGVPETSLKHILVGAFQIGAFKLYPSLLWWLGLALVLHFVLNFTPFGNWIMATGGNAQAARARGTNTDRVKIALFMLTSTLAGFSSVISSLRLEKAYPVAGESYELQVIAMSVIGGTSLLGGRGTIVGAVIGAFLLRTMRNGLNFTQIPGQGFDLFIGVIIIAMMILHSAMERKARLGEK